MAYKELQPMGPAKMDQLPAASTTKLYGNLKQSDLQSDINDNFDPNPPADKPKCEVPNMPPLQSLIPKVGKPRKPLRGRINRTGPRPLQGKATDNVPGPLKLQTPTPATPKPATPPLQGKATDGGPPGVPRFNPENPQYGQWVPPKLRGSIPEGFFVDPNGYLHPKEAVPNSGDELIPVMILTWILMGPFSPFTPVTRIPPPTTIPITPQEEQVWVNVTKDGTRIIWREGERWYQRTVNGKMMNLSDALKLGAREKLPGWYQFKP
jgi:hypothetical protein